MSRLSVMDEKIVFTVNNTELYYYDIVSGELSSSKDLFLQAHSSGIIFNCPPVTPYNFIIEGLDLMGCISEKGLNEHLLKFNPFINLLSITGYRYQLWHYFLAYVIDVNRKHVKDGLLYVVNENCLFRISVKDFTVGWPAFYLFPNWEFRKFNEMEEFQNWLHKKYITFEQVDSLKMEWDSYLVEDKITPHCIYIFLQKGYV